MRAILSLIVAVVATVVGEALLWGGGATALRFAQQGLSFGPRSVIPFALIAGGIVLVAVAMLTASWSSLGVIVMGVVHLVVGIAALVVAPAVEYAVLRPLHQSSPEVAAGVDYAAGTGMLLLVGVVMFVGGIAVAARRPRPGAAGRVTSLVLALVLGIGLLPLLVIGGFRVLQAIALRTSAAVELLGALLVAGAAVLLVLVVATVRWSSLGAFVIGGLLTVAGFVALFAPPLFYPGLRFERELLAGSVYIAGTGQLALLGMLLLMTAIAGLVRGARRRRLEPVAEVEERIGYQTEDVPQRTLDDVFPRAGSSPTATTSIYDPPAPPPGDRV